MERDDRRRSSSTMDTITGPHLPGISGIPRRQPPPLPTNPLVGRDDDLALVLRLLERRASRVVSLLGPGGVGKTRLALTAAHRLVGDFAHGVLFLRLDRLDAASLWEAIGRHIGLTSGQDTTSADAIIEALRGQELLLVLDNAESMIEAMVELPTLLHACPGVMTLATSRETLRLPGEHEVWLAPLPVPDESTDASRSPAMELFISRARQLRHDFAVTDCTCKTIERIVRRLDGLPVALELAAAYLRHLSPDEVLAMLDDAMPALGGGPRTLPARQQSLRDLVRWSLDLLPPDTRDDAIRLAVFSNGFTPTSVAAILESGSLRDAWDLTLTLADRSLIQRAPSAGDGDRTFTMLQTIRSVLLDELEGSPDLRSTTLDRLSRALVRLAKDADRHYHGPEGPRWLRRMREASPDVHLVITRSRTDPALRPAALELCGDMFWFWYSQGHYQWALPRIEELLNLAGDEISPETRARAHVTAGWFAHRMAQIERTERHFRAARELFGNTPSRGVLLGMVGYSYVLTFERPDAPAAIEELERVIALAPEVENAWHEEAAGQFGIGILRYFAGRLDDARKHLIETLRLGRAHNDSQSIGMSLVYLAHVDRANGMPAEAYWKLREALPLLMEIGDLATTALVLDIVSATLVELEACELAMQALALGEHLRGTMSLPRSPLELPDAEATRARIDCWRAASGLDIADGSTLDLGETIDRLLRFDPERAPRAATTEAPEEPAGQTVLSPRELEVLHLVSTGMTSSEIAASLFVSPHTVKRHMANIREKLGVRSQAAAIAALRDQGA